jgi:hypothetical protein
MTETAAGTNFGLIFEPQEASNVLQATATFVPGSTADGKLTIRATNWSATPVDVVVQVDGGDTIIDTDYFTNGGAQIRRSARSAPYVNQTIKIVRWAPDIVGIPGDGGGDIKFTMPFDGSVIIDLTIVNG